MNYYDTLATDIMRIQNAKKVLERTDTSRKEKEEAISMLNLYRDIATEMLKESEQRYRAEEVLVELGGRWA